MQISSAASMISSKWSSARRFSIFAMTRTDESPARASASRTARTSSAPRTNGCSTSVTPKRPATARFSRSSSVSAGASVSRPRIARLLRLCSVPPRSTRQRSAPRSHARTSNSSALSSSAIRSPRRAVSNTICGTGTPPAPRTVSPPSVSAAGSASRPTRSSGPCRSITNRGETPVSSAAARNSASSGAHAASPVWDRLSRAAVIPSRNISASVSRAAHAAPSVA